MSRIRWGDLTEEEKLLCAKAGIVNGCGPKYRWVNYLVPDVLFGLHITDDCNHHDFNYWLGGSQADRLKADYQLYERIFARAKAATESWWWRWLRPAYYAAAWTYYRAVRYFGAYDDLWHTGPERTREDLEGVLLPFRNKA